jgi:hypothetical protein
MAGSKKIIIIVSVIVGIGLITAGIFVTRSVLANKKYNEYMDSGNKFLSEQKYDEAIQAFKDAQAIKESDAAKKAIEDAVSKKGNYEYESKLALFYNDAPGPLQKILEIRKGLSSAYGELEKGTTIDLDFMDKIKKLQPLAEEGQKALDKLKTYGILNGYVDSLGLALTSDKDMLNGLVKAIDKQDYSSLPDLDISRLEAYKKQGAAVTVLLDEMAKHSKDTETLKKLQAELDKAKMPEDKSFAILKRSFKRQSPLVYEEIGFVLNGKALLIGDEGNRITQVLGNPQKVESIFNELWGMNEKIYTYSNLKVFAVDEEGTSGRVMNFDFTGGNYRTVRGLKIGDTAARMTALYGKESMKDGDIYSFAPPDESHNMISVFIKNGKVTRIAAGVVD